MTQPLPARQEERQLSPLGEVKRTLASNLKTVNALLAGYTTPERFMGGIVTAMQINPDLQQCSPQSVLLASLRVAQLRLSPDPALGQAYLIPRDGRAEFQLGYRGTLQLLYRSPLVRNVRYNVVRRGERFRWIDGASWTLEHEPGTEGWPTTWEELVAAWAIIELVNGGQIPRVMYADEIRRHKERGRGKQPAWNTDLGAMAAKTVLGDAARRGPLDGESLLGVNLDHQGEVGLQQQTADLEELVAPQAAAQRAAEAIVGKGRRITEEDKAAAVEKINTTRATGIPAELQPDGRVTVEMPESAVVHHERLPSTPAPLAEALDRAVSAVADRLRNEESALPPGGSKKTAPTTEGKPWQPVLDLNLPRVGDTIASRLHTAGLDSYERILEAGRYKVAEIPGISDLSAQAIILHAERALNPEPAAAAEAAPPPPPAPPAEEPDPFEGMETAPPASSSSAGTIEFPGQAANLPRGYRPPATSAYDPQPPTKPELQPITSNEAFAIERHAIRTKRGGAAPGTREGDDIARAALRAFIEDTFVVALDKLPRYFFRAALEWAQADGQDPQIEELRILRERGYIR